MIGLSIDFCNNYCATTQLIAEGIQSLDGWRDCDGGAHFPEGGDAGRYGQRKGDKKVIWVLKVYPVN